MVSSILPLSGVKNGINCEFQQVVVYFLVVLLNDTAFWSGPKNCMYVVLSVHWFFHHTICVHINTFLSINCLFYLLLCLQIGFAAILCKIGCYIASLYVWCSRGSLFHAERGFQVPCMFWWFSFLLKPDEPISQIIFWGKSPFCIL